jgi:hypothetical protein
MMNQTEKKGIFKLFIDGYFDLLEFIKTHSNNNSDFKKFYMKNYLLKKANIKLFIKTWYESITVNYYQPIMNENVEYFLNKSYDSEVSNVQNQFNIKYYISYFKTIYNKLDRSLIQGFINKIKYVTQLSYIYYKK